MMNADVFIRKMTVAVMMMFLLATGFTLRAVAVEDVPDFKIKNAIDVEMLYDESVNSTLIDLQVNDGIVTLSGTVDNLMKRERAIEIARSVKGVRSIVDQIEVDAVSRLDNDIKNDVDYALLMDPAADSYELEVSVDSGVVTLSGTVESWQEKQLAIDVAQGVRGVRLVTDDIEIDYPATRIDSEIKADIRRWLDRDVRVDAELIDISVDDGVVTLTGTVGSAAEKQRATVDAWVMGTSDVDNSGLTVEWWARDRMKRNFSAQPLSEDEIKSAIQDAFIYDPRVFAFNPEITVEGGEVFLSGTVDNLQAKWSAEETAENTIGVWTVHNLLKVRPKIKPNDKELVSQVETAVARDPYLDIDDIDVKSKTGEIYLHGVVGSEYEKERAGLAAGTVFGVLDVNNFIVVVRDAPYKTDFELAMDVRDQLYWSPFVNANEISVTVEDSIVTLEGSVDSWSERRIAVSNALQAGADDVRNRLAVTSTPDIEWPWATNINN